MTMSGDAASPQPIIVTGDPDLRDLIPGYLANRRKDLPVLLAALDEKDLAVIQRLAHRMKGEGGGYGFDAITTIGAALEEAAKQGKVPEVRMLLADLASFLERVHVVYP
jgi:HPt (histidine-containing phosphotransfer) domain-containing protein